MLVCWVPVGMAAPHTQASTPANLWVCHAAYMFYQHGKNVTLIYEPPVSVAAMAFMPTPFNQPEFVLSQLNNLNKSSIFCPRVQELNNTRFRQFHYQRSLPGLCFCCHAQNAMFSWKDKSWADSHWASKAVNQTHCLDHFYLHGPYNSSYSVNETLMNTTMKEIFHNLPMFSPNASAISGGSICGNWLIKDPNLWFFWGGGIATNYHPGKYQCASIGFLTLPVQVVHPQIHGRRKRTPLGSACSDIVVTDNQVSGGPASWGGGHAVLSSLLGVLTLGAYPGVVSQENRASIIGLTCRLERTVNATTRIVQDLQTEIASLHQVQIQHRFALDFLLARQGGFCKIVGQAGCAVTFHDLNTTIEDELNNLRKLLQDNVAGASWDPFSWLTSWLPDAAWLRQLLCGLILLLCIPQA